MSLPDECRVCKLRGVFCGIDAALEQDAERWEAFATECSNLDELERIVKVEERGINRFDREQIVDETFSFFFSPSLLIFPVETMKRVLTDKWNDVFPEYASDPQTSNHIKWTLRLEVISKFCQLSETLAAHLMASEEVGNNYETFAGYTTRLIDYNVNDAVGFFQRLQSYEDEEISQIMCYPDSEGQSNRGRELLNESILFLKTELSVIGAEYIKFKGLYNAFKHGCRLLHPETMTMEGEDYVACIMYLTRKAAPHRGGQISFLGFPNDDFRSFYEHTENINRILGTMFHNRKERYLLSNGLSDSVSVALYFPKEFEEFFSTDEVEFAL